MVSFLEVPDEITLAINISNCPHRCLDCHSPYLQQDIGENLTIEALTHLIESNKGISCIAFLGGDNDLMELAHLNEFVKTNYPKLKTCWYTGSNFIPPGQWMWWLMQFDYIKFGQYIKEFGPLSNKNTNQKFYYHDKKDNTWNNITYKFWKND